MKLLVLGGTVFVGRAIARQALAAGHDVTCAARGVSGGPVDGVRFVEVDRDLPDGLAPFVGEEFDALIDVSRRPSQARRAAITFADTVGHAVYVSSCSVYAHTRAPGQRAETSVTLDPLPSDADETADDAQTYGRAKVASEIAYLDAFGPGRSFVCRAGLIVGPEDPMGRFEYWVRRIAAGGEVVVPGEPTNPVQLVDVRDLVDWLITAGTSRLSGIYDGIGAPMTRAAFLDGIAAGVGTAPTYTYVPQEYLFERKIQAWDGDRSLPIWVPLPDYAGFMCRDVDASLAAGLRCRSLAETARATWSWLNGRPPAPTPGIDRATENKLLAGWKTDDRHR